MAGGVYKLRKNCPKPEGREPIRTNGSRSETARETKTQGRDPIGVRWLQKK